MNLIKDEKELKLSYEKKSNLSDFQIKTILSNYTKNKKELLIDLENIKIEEIIYEDLKQKLLSLKEKIKKKLEDKKLEKMIIDLEENFNAIENDNNEQNNSSIINENQQNKLMTQLKIKNIQKNSEALKIRRENLTDIQIIATQIKDLTNDMKIRVNNDDEAFKNIEDKVIEVNENVDRGFKDIKEIQKGMKENNKKVCCVIFLIIFVVVILCVVIYALYSDFFYNLF
jgi:t-SNARE complex subunit (syntaxin)